MTLAMVAGPGSALAAQDCEALQDIDLTDTEIRSTQWVEPTENRPGYCEVKAFVSPPGYSNAAESGIGVEVWLPSATHWNGKLQVVGNGGYSPRISYGSMTDLLQQGYATAGTDTGHSGESMLFVVDHRERIDYWGYLAVHETAEKSKAFINELYGQPAQYAYFNGCSTGGHQALMEAQRYPQDFDGIVAGAPGNNRTALNGAFLWQFIQNHETGQDTAQIIPEDKLPLIAQASLAACDDVDGLADGIIDDPRQCDFDPAVLLCEGEDGSDCLTARQVAALEEMYRGAHNPRTDEQIYPGFPVGSEMGWGSYWSDFFDPNKPARVDFWRYWVFENPDWNWWSFDWDQDMAYAWQKMGPLIDAVDPDLTGFEAAGGKLILYHGWADPVVSGVDTVDYYQEVVDTLGSRERTEYFARLFMVPAMGHCGGGAGPSRFDVQSALEQWVEEGIAPERLLASKIEDGTEVMTRPLCPYPQVARYTGQGSTDEATSFVCQEPGQLISLMDRINQLSLRDELDRGIVLALGAKLDTVQSLMDRGRPDLALRLVQANQRQLAALLRAGRLADGVGEELAERHEDLAQALR